jgi:integrating conjugative element membrane protein (TIGR03745 family)
MKALTYIRRHTVTRWFAPLLLLLANSAAYAALPTTAPPTRGAPAGNFITLLQNYAFDIAVFGGLAIAVVVFFIVSKNVIQTYSLVPEGRSTMGQVGMQAGVGVLLLVFIIFLLTQAAVIL